MDRCARVVKGDDGIISERCYRPTYSNDSRKWIMRDGTPLQPLKGSEFKNAYRYPRVESPVMGKRAKIMREKLLREAEMELKTQSNEPPAVEEYITTHDQTYCPKIPGFQSSPGIKKNPELYEKYPLYASSGMSHWQFLYKKSYGNKSSVTGVTKIVDVTNPFRKNSLFSTPVSLRDGVEEY